jgi:hypothetical protein
VPAPATPGRIRWPRAAEQVAAATRNERRRRVGGSTLKPVGFFDRDPSLDIPPPQGHDAGHCHTAAD